MKKRAFTLITRAVLALLAAACTLTTYAAQTELDSVTRMLRLKLSTGPYDSDDILIAFNSGATALYNSQYDAKFFAGDGAETLSSYSADGVPLTVNFLPLPGHGSEVIRLDVEARNSGPILLQRTKLDSLPPSYSVWLVDRYTKDSLNLRTDSSYTFMIDKADTTSFGSCRLSVVVSYAAAPFKLLGFNAAKEADGSRLSWTTQNEENRTQFIMQQSINSGATFTTIDSVMSTSAGRYGFTDKTPAAGRNEYLLKIIDASGIVTYSNIATLYYDESVNIRVFPNPTSDILQLAIAQPATGSPVYSINIVNMNGTLVKTVTSLSGKWEGNVSSLRPGAYIVGVMNNATGQVVGKATFIKL